MAGVGRRKRASLVEGESHGPEVADGGLLDDLLRRRTFQTLHCISHRLLRLQQVLHLCGEQKLQAGGVTKPAGHQLCVSRTPATPTNTGGSYFSAMESLLACCL